MIPGFVTLFRDKGSKIHLFFYPGLLETGETIYHDLDISKTKLKYNTIEHSDKSKEFIFERKDIIKIKCKLIKNDGKIDYEELIA